MAKMFGKATVTVDGKKLAVDNDSSLNLGGNKNNTVKGTEVYGFAQETQEASVTLNSYIASGDDLDALNNATDVTVQFAADTGQNYVLAHAWLESPVEAKAATSGGKTALKYCAAKAQKVA